ncbi:pentatricopeptide repeat-containing protein 2, mitochondrial-like isoform X2 [Contarinia nasturtii]|uniref:pentatricopeptide repeat-containing protein 2, mitochondrial-like isoform X2 n=1 Tax=Contarinia nasturtii TaxID=265458 RepID=UPI0012D41663|nr:pentatricopeptide repeat-containing protein 2, mitochondrial-like isoform X2 [Contarinia nasturtii]
MNIVKILVNKRFLLNLVGNRTLFTKDSLGIAAYIANRELEHEFTTKPEEFKKDFLRKVEKGLPLNLLIDNLKRFIHVIGNEPQDIDLLWRALRMYKSKHDQMRRRSELEAKKLYTFGPIIMRVLHHFNLTEYAIKFFDDGHVTQLFDQLVTYQILLDLLYDNRQYGDVLRIYHEIEKRILDQNRYVSNEINAIIFATYFRLNTPMHNQLAYDMYKNLKDQGTHIKQYRKSIGLVAAMQLRLENPDKSLEILSIYDDTDVNIRYVRILSHVHLHQFDDAFRLLEMTIASPKAILIPDQLLQKIEGKMRKLHDDRIDRAYKSIFDELKRKNLIFYKRLDDVLCARFPTAMAPYRPVPVVGL